MGAEVLEQKAVVPFYDIYFTSEAFEDLYRRGMLFVEVAAAYLDGAGKEDQRYIDRHLQSVFGTESMRLTTRLMQLESWLLLMNSRAKDRGDMEVFMRERDRRVLNAIDTCDEVFERPLPVDFLSLIRQSLELMTEIKRLDARLFPERKRTP